MKKKDITEIDLPRNPKSIQKMMQARLTPPDLGTVYGAKVPPTRTRSRVWGRLSGSVTDNGYIEAFKQLVWNVTSERGNNPNDVSGLRDAANIDEGIVDDYSTDFRVSKVALRKYLRDKVLRGDLERAYCAVVLNSGRRSLRTFNKVR